MKKLIPVLLISLLMAKHSFSQQADTMLNARMARIENNIEYLKQQLINSHGQFRIGTASLLTGCALSAWGAISKQPQETRISFF